MYRRVGISSYNEIDSEMSVEEVCLCLCCGVGCCGGWGVAVWRYIGESKKAREEREEVVVVSR